MATTARSSRARGHATALRASQRHNQTMSHSTAIVEPSQPPRLVASRHSVTSKQILRAALLMDQMDRALEKFDEFELECR